MTSKEQILNDIKNNNIVSDTSLPDYADFGLTFDNKFDQFATMIESVGGKALFATRDALDTVIRKLYPDEKTIASNVDGCTLGNFDPQNEDDPHNLKDIDLAVVKGEFAVAENGAVWMKNSENRHRSLYFIAQNIVIVVDKKSILNNMHEAYELISFHNPSYGTFISGPSKTADIEQSLVIGAHGPKSGYVIFVE